MRYAGCKTLASALTTDKPTLNLYHYETEKLMNKWLLIAVAGMLSLAFTGCESNDDNKTFIYTIGMENYQYTGSSLLGPLSYLSSLNLSEGFTITAANLTEANAEAITRFNAEMAKIEKAHITSR